MSIGVTVDVEACKRSACRLPGHNWPRNAHTTLSYAGKPMAQLWLVHAAALQQWAVTQNT
jgi:hypothetical protein